jgi:hypothetical protein
MALAENPRARLGGNFPPPDDEERAPPKHLRVISKEEAEVFRVIVRVLATRFELAKWRVTEKRKGGDDGRTVRCLAIGYMRGVNFPVWKLEMMWDLNRKQIGQEEEAYLRMRADNTFVDTQASHMEGMLDEALAIDVDEFMSEATAEIVSIIETRRRTKKERSEIKAEARANPPPPVPKHIPTQAELLRDAANAKHRIDRLESETKVNLRVILAASEPGAGKEAKRDAAKARDAIELAHAEIKKLRRLKAPAPKAVLS